MPKEGRRGLDLSVKGLVTYAEKTTKDVCCRVTAGCDVCLVVFGEPSGAEGGK